MLLNTVITESVKIKKKVSIAHYTPRDKARLRISSFTSHTQWLATMTFQTQWLGSRRQIRVRPVSGACETALLSDCILILRLLQLPSYSELNCFSICLFPVISSSATYVRNNITFLFIRGRSVRNFIVSIRYCSDSVSSQDQDQ